MEERATDYAGVQGARPEHRAHGDADRARAAFESVQRADPGFPGIAAALASLGAADDAESGAEAEPEVFESFDDVVAEAEADEAPEANRAPAADEAPGADEAPAADPAPDTGGAAAAPDAPDGDSSGDKPRRKKKISFV